MDKVHILVSCRDIFLKGKGYEPVIEFLKGLGLSKIQSMLYLVESEIASLQEAKEIVHKSIAWAERRDADEEFQERLHDAISGKKEN